MSPVRFFAALLGSLLLAGPGRAQDAGALVPLSELGEKEYKGEKGGLYGEGRNEPPAAHAERVAREVARIQPLDAEGNPAPDGKIVFLALGMSNTRREFEVFKERAEKLPEKAPSVVIVNGALGGKDAPRWTDPGAPQWKAVDESLKESGAGPLQVQAAWLKQAVAGPAGYGEFPKHARTLHKALGMIVQIAKKRYPNLRVVYLSSRTYAGYARTPLNPEPYAYESAFAVRWLIRDQIAGKADLNFDPGAGEVKAPALVWGPYLWASGPQPRRGDGLAWKESDFDKDGTHPGDEGKRKVSDLLIAFLTKDPLARSWFAR